jgi:uncharacterized lipoprotein NlpE involved in copper resistance
MKLLSLLLVTLLLFGCQKSRDARELKKQHKAEAIPMSGMLSYLADAASLLDCRTSEQYVVKFKGDWLAVERAYINFGKPGMPIYVEFRGRLESDSTDGNVRLGIVIEEITGMRPDTSCLSRM